MKQEEISLDCPDNHRHFRAENCACLWYYGTEEMAEGVTYMRKAEWLLTKESDRR